jgi:hypothetical protein
MAHQLTIRYDDVLAREIEGLAQREGISRNQAIVRLLRKGAHLQEPEQDRGVIGDSLDWFIGSWTPEQARELEEAVSTPHDADHLRPLKRPSPSSERTS